MARLSGSSLRVEDVRKAMRGARAQHSYLQAAVDSSRKGVGQSPLDEIPLTVESLEESFEDRDQERLEAVRKIVRRELLQGIPILETFARAHLISEAKDSSVHHLILMADHVAFDGRSLFAWLDSLLTFLDPATDPERITKDADLGLELIDWTERIPESVPNLEKTPPQGRSIAPDVSSNEATSADNSASSDGVCMVEDTVLHIDPDTFSRLKNVSKKHELSLNGPLFVAFASAVAELAVSRGEELPFMAAGSCAVDVRRMVEPPLPSRFISSVSGTANAGVEIKPGTDLWSASSALHQSLNDAIHAGEPFRVTQLVKRGDYAAIGPLFAVSFIWSNIGHYSGVCDTENVSLQLLESHLMGEGTNPLVSVHLVEVREKLSVSLTYSPKFHSRDSMSFLLSRFGEYVHRLATVDKCTFQQ